MNVVALSDRRCLPRPGKYDRQPMKVKLDDKQALCLVPHEPLIEKYRLHAELFSLDYDIKSGFNLSPAPMLDLSSFESRVMAVESRLDSLSQVISQSNQPKDK